MLLIDVVPSIMEVRSLHSFFTVPVCVFRCGAESNHRLPPTK
ncbi:unnamed protein product [Larinioides sclopetarius]|uniref:Uncharacterized protein n=1 Tax=Larinioides sclopetarius TaxID=280406 RepID=A0AAV1ZRE7_9ARAC